MIAYSYITHLKEAAGKPEQQFWIQKMSVLEGVKYFQTFSHTERTMMMALLAYAPNPLQLIVNKMTDDYYEALDAVFNYKIFRQEERPADPIGHEPFPKFKQPEILKKLPAIKW